MTFSIDHPLFWFYLLYISLVISALLHMLYQRRTPQNLMSWLLALLLLPYIGVVLYLIFGSRKLLQKRSKPLISMHPLQESKPETPLAIELDNLLRANQIAGTTDHNQVSFCEDGTLAFERLLEEIQNAQSSIHIETYIFKLDCTGKAILQALIDKAQAGVEVKLLLDAVGSLRLYLNSTPLNILRQAGGEFAFFQPIWPSLIASQVNLRNHRKIYLFDQTTLLTGGMNLSNDYLGTAKYAEQHWIDILLKIKGPNVFHHQSIFNADWLYATGKRLPEPHPIKPDSNADIMMQAVPSGPDIDSDALFETLLFSIHQARSHIQIVTPYFIPDSAVLNALLMALKRGVKVTLLTPESSDHLIFDLGRSSYMREIAEHGGEICYYQGTMLHAKLILIDQQMIMIGSANLDYRSLFINHEMVNFIYSKELIEQMSNWTTGLLKNSRTYQPSDNKVRRLLENLTRIVAPIL